jgi:hypothetical protein
MIDAPGRTAGKVDATGPSSDGDPDFAWHRVLEPGERLVWTGRPAHGRRFLETVGEERIWHRGFLIGAIAIWLTLPLLDGWRAREAVWVYGFVTLAFAFSSARIAWVRSRILRSMHYAITDRRAIVCREGRDHDLRLRTYVVSCPYHLTSLYTFPIEPAHPHPSVTMGSMLNDNLVQPLGHGLTHPGWPMLRTRGIIPILFESQPEAEAIRRLLMDMAVQARLAEGGAA